MRRRFEPPAPIENELVPFGSGQEILVLRVSNIAVEATQFTYDGRPYHRIGTTTSVMPQETYQRQLLERTRSAAMGKRAVLVYDRGSRRR